MPPEPAGASRPLLVEGYVIALGLRVALRAFSVPRTVRGLAALPRARRADSSAVPLCLSAAALASSRAAHPTCLYRALIAFALLSRRGVPVSFHLGAGSGQFSAHAWVSVDGRPLDAEAGSYVPLWMYRLDVPGAA